MPGGKKKTLAESLAALEETSPEEKAKAAAAERAALRAAAAAEAAAAAAALVALRESSERDRQRAAEAAAAEAAAATAAAEAAEAAAATGRPPKYMYQEHYNIVKQSPMARTRTYRTSPNEINLSSKPNTLTKANYNILKSHNYTRNADQKNVSMRKLIKYNKTGPGVTRKAIADRWDNQIQKILARINLFFRSTRLASLATLETGGPESTDRIIKFIINERPFHITFHINYNTAVPGTPAGAFHIKDDSNGKTAYRFIPYVHTEDDIHYIKLAMTSLPRIEHTEVYQHIKYIAAIVSDTFNYRLRPRGDTHLKRIINLESGAAGGRRTRKNRRN